MTTLIFEWDEKKNISNKKKHKISFEEAQTVFSDENALLIHDPDHPVGGNRFVLLGLSLKLRILVVCHCCQKSDSVIRIISARKAIRLEQRRYWDRWQK